MTWTDGHSDSSSAQVIYSDGPELTRAAKLKDLARPDFGRGSPNLHLRGVVILEHVVGTDGHSDSSSAQVIYSDGPELTRAAVGAVLGGRFEPALAQGVPV